MTPIYKPLLLAALLAAASLGAQAQTSTGHAGMQRHADPAKMLEMHARHQTELKTKLNLSPAQENAWASYAAATQPPTAMAARMDPERRKKMRDDMQKLTTPERIDRMNAIKAERDAEMAKRGAATKAFYAELTPQQQQVFDANAMRHGPRHGMGKDKTSHNG